MLKGQGNNGAKLCCRNIENFINPGHVEGISMFQRRQIENCMAEETCPGKLDITCRSSNNSDVIE